MSYAIYHDLTINASIKKVYEAISEPKHLVNWWPLKCEGIPKEGEVYNFFFGSEYDWYGEVIKSEKNKSFHIKMTSSDDDWNPTSFGFDLEESTDNVLIHFWHLGWTECSAHYKRSSFCWAMLLNGLKNYVENGIIIPFEERE